MLVDEAFIDALKKSASVLSHTMPKGDERDVLAHGLKLILEAAAKKHDPAAVKPRKSSRVLDEESRYIPAALERQVWARDHSCCSWMTSSGACGSTYQLEIDHIVALALGGKTILENLRLVCR